MHKQVAISVAHVTTALNVSVECALRVDADVVADEAVFEHEVLEGVLFCAAVFAAHEHGVVGHDFEEEAREGGAAEESTARVDGLVVLRDENVDFLDAEVRGRVDVCGVLLQLAVEDRGVAHESALEGGGGEQFADEVVGCVHEDDVGVDEPDPFGGGVEVEGFGDGGDFGPCLSNRYSVQSSTHCALIRRAARLTL